MSERSLHIDGIEYLRSRDAARIVHLAPDYASRLARGGLIDGRLIEGLLVRRSRVPQSIHRRPRTPKRNLAIRVGTPAPRRATSRRAPVGLCRIIYATSQRAQRPGSKLIFKRRNVFAAQSQHQFSVSACSQAWLSRLRSLLHRIRSRAPRSEATSAQRTRHSPTPQHHLQQPSPTRSATPSHRSATSRQPPISNSPQSRAFRGLITPATSSSAFSVPSFEPAQTHKARNFLKKPIHSTQHLWELSSNLPFSSPKG